VCVLAVGSCQLISVCVCVSYELCLMLMMNSELDRGTVFAYTAAVQ